MDRPVCTRIAPSPTGDPHIGTVYMALFNLVFARQHNGKFILRIEDTDQTRSTAASEQAIYDALNWAGIEWDEGPFKGGSAGPYKQSERTGIYRDHVKKLVDSDRAYYCFCSPERLTELRKEQMAAKNDPRYDGLCCGLSAHEVSRRLAAGEKHVIRLKIPEDGECIMQDRLRGEIRINWKNVDHQVLQKTDGFPTYHLANVVDDYLMGITHVIRGEEWISSLPKHVLLYEAFGWEKPEFIHLPLLRNPDKSKLSKRKNPTSVFYYRDAGILPEALLNYLGMMGYTLPDGTEMFNVEQMAADFDIGRVSLGGPVFDPDKLAWLNGRYLRETMDAAAILERLKNWKLNDEMMLKLIPLAQKRLSTLGDFLPMVSFMFCDQLEYDPASLISKQIDGERMTQLLQLVLWEAEKLRVWDAEEVRELFMRISEKEDLKLKHLLAPFFVAVTGKAVSLPLFDSAAIMGIDIFRRRLSYARDGLAGLGFALKGKKLKSFEKEYRRSW
jgi:glutamyl-tRNA synthetase